MVKIPHCPHHPWPKQSLFLRLNAKEAFYGGAAAGGKSDSLLMGALQHISVPGYAALILRRDTQRLRLAGGLITRSHEWLSHTSARWRANERRWVFPTGAEEASISFGYLKSDDDKFRYGSSEYQYIAFDELTEFTEADYLFLFSRLRRRHGVSAPLRVRAASNPGNLGHGWVKRRFIPLSEIKLPIMVNGQPQYVPARLADNIAIGADEYRDCLEHLPAVERERLLHGDWVIQQDALIRAEQVARYFVRGRLLDLLSPRGELLGTVDDRACRRYATIDPASTSAADAAASGGRTCWTVVQVWDQPGDARLRAHIVLRHVERVRMSFTEILPLVARVKEQWDPQRIYVEQEATGRALVTMLEGRFPIELIRTGGKHKMTRAARLFAKLGHGEVHLPRESLPWLAELESEWLSWTGGEREICDQIDAAAYAAIVSDDWSVGPIRWEPVRAA